MCVNIHIRPIVIYEKNFFSEGILGDTFFPIKLITSHIFSYNLLKFEH